MFTSIYASINNTINTYNTHKKYCITSNSYPSLFKTSPKAVTFGIKLSTLLYLFFICASNGVPVVEDTVPAIVHEN